MGIWLVAAATLLSLGGVATAQSPWPEGQDRVHFAPTPGWVDSVDMPEPRAERIDQTTDGVYYLIYDIQSRIAEDHYVEHRRIAMKVLDPSGLENAGRLSHTFDPYRERFTIHAVRIWRDGVPLDRLEPDKVRVVREETKLYDGLVLGKLTAFAELTDVRVGDIVDVEVSWMNRNPLWPGGYSRHVSMEWSVPLALQRYRLLTQKGAPLAVKVENIAITPAVRGLERFEEREWRRLDGEILKSDDAAPEFYRHWGGVSVSTMPDWTTVARWAQGVFDVDLELQAETVEAVFGDDSDALGLDEKITNAIRYVQDDIRYVGDEVGLGSHVPRPPQRIVGLGYGDCKDKALLLVALLRRIGVEAYPALVDSSRGPALPERLASPFAFDHAIVLIVSKGRNRWIDPTVSHQGGVFPRIAAPNLGYALPVREGQTQLEAIEIDDLRMPTMETVETFDFGADNGADIEMKVETMRRRREADRFRAELATSARSDYADNYLNFYAAYLPGIEKAADLDFYEDRNRNFIRVTERYRIPRASFDKDDGWKNFPLRAESILGLLKPVDGADRDSPIATPYPVNRLHKLRLVNSTTKFHDDFGASMRTAYANFDATSAFVGKGLELSVSLWTTAPAAPAGALDEFNRLADYVAENADLNIDLSDAPAFTPGPTMLFEPENDAKSIDPLILFAIIGLFLGLVVFMFAAAFRFVQRL